MNACIVRCSIDDKVLLVKHKTRGWEFPGGKIDNEKDRFENTEMIDLLHTATREFHEEVSGQIGCVGSPTKVLFNTEYKTVFFVYTKQMCIFDCFDEYEHFLVSEDEAIEDVEQFSIEDINNITFSFENDKKLIETIFTPK